jgi:hypothetical protein
VLGPEQARASRDYRDLPAKVKVFKHGHEISLGPCLTAVNDKNRSGGKRGTWRYKK